MLNEKGEPISTQRTKDSLVAFVELAPLSFTTFSKGELAQPIFEQGHGLTLENELIRYEFDRNGQIISAFDKNANKEVLESSGNILSLYEDRPNDWDAWDVDFFYRDALLEIANATDTMPGAHGDMVQELNLTFSIGNSVIQQHIKLSKQSKRLDFETKVDWQETHKMRSEEHTSELQSQAYLVCRLLLEKKKTKTKKKKYRSLQPDQRQ